MLGEGLDENEVVELGEFLAAADDRLPLVACEGFLAGIVSSPVVVPASRWFPIVFGSDDVFDDVGQANRIVELVMRFSNSIAARLYRGEVFEPAIGDANGDLSLGAAIVWAHGYMKAVQLETERWTELDRVAQARLLQPIVTLATVTDLEPERDADLRRAASELADCVCDIYAYWLERRRRPLRRATPKVGRNDACPCGSGRKAKRCCGTGAS